MRCDGRTAALAALLGLAAAPAARADMRMVQVVTTIGHYGGNARKMTLTPPPLGAAPGPVDNTVRVTLSVRGEQSRADDGAFSMIIDRTTRRETFLDRTRRAYLQDDWDPASTSGTQDAQLDVHRTGSTARLLGHPAHEYVLSGTLQGYTVSGTVWAADDLAQPVIPSTLGGQSTLAWSDKVPGLVLKMNLFVGVPEPSSTGAQTTPVTWRLRSETLALSTAPLPASAFAIPAGYKLLKPTPAKALVPR